MAKVVLVRDDYAVVDPFQANFYDGARISIEGNGLYIRSVYVSTHEKDGVLESNPKACTLYVSKVPPGVKEGSDVMPLSPPMPELEKAISSMYAEDANG